MVGRFSGQPSVWRPSFAVTPHPRSPLIVFSAFAPCLPDSYAPMLGEVLEYRQLSNHPVLQSAANQREVSADGRRVQAFDTHHLSRGRLK